MALQTFSTVSEMSISNIHDADFHLCGSKEIDCIPNIEEFDNRSEENLIDTSGLKLVTLHQDGGRVIRREWLPRHCGDGLRAAGALFPTPKEDVLDTARFCQQLGMTDAQFQELLSVGYYLGYDEERASGARMKEFYEFPIIPSTEFEARLSKQLSISKLEHTPYWAPYIASDLEQKAKEISIVTRENDFCVRKAFAANSATWEMPPYSMALDVIDRLRSRHPGSEYRVTWWDITNKAVRVVLAVNPKTDTQYVPVCGIVGKAAFCPGLEIMISQTSFCAPTIRDVIVVDGRDALIPSSGVTVRECVEMDDLIDAFEAKKVSARAMDASNIAGMADIRLKGNPKDTLLAVMSKAGIAHTGKCVGKLEPGLPARAHQPLWNAVLATGVRTMADLYVWIIRMYISQTPDLSTSNQEKIRTWLGSMVSWNAIVRTGRRRA